MLILQSLYVEQSSSWVFSLAVCCKNKNKNKNKEPARVELRKKEKKYAKPADTIQNEYRTI